MERRHTGLTETRRLALIRLLPRDGVTRLVTHRLELRHCGSRPQLPSRRCTVERGGKMTWHSNPRRIIWSIRGARQPYSDGPSLLLLHRNLHRMG